MAGVSDGLGERGQHRDTVCGVVEEFPGIYSDPKAIDDTKDLVLLRMPDQAVGGLAVLLAELALAVNDRGVTSRHWEGSRRQDPFAPFGRIKKGSTACE